jgi:hypothetical protein
LSRQREQYAENTYVAWLSALGQLCPESSLI